MTIRSLLLALAVTLITGCGGQPSNTETPVDHPANHTAAETPTPQRSRTLQDQGTVPSSPSSNEQKNAAVVYACPHHPEVVSNEPGVCPKCEMKLQPQKPAAGKTSPGGATGGGGSHEGHGGH